MAHYITGELPLYSLQANSKGNRTSPNELRFIVDGDALVVDEVSEYAGVRLGAKLKGWSTFDKYGHPRRDEITPITAAEFPDGVGVIELNETLGLNGDGALALMLTVKPRANSD